MAVCLAVLALIGLAARRYAHSERDQAVEAWRARLTGMADDREKALEAWLHERWGDARVVASFPGVPALLAGQAAKVDAEKAHLTLILGSLKASYGYLGAYVLDGRGELVVAAPDSPPLPPDFVKAARTMAANQAERATFYRGARTGRRRLGFTVPVDTVPGPFQGPRTGWVLLVMDPARWLFPLMEREPIPTLTGENVLAEPEDGKILFLSPLRFKPAELLSFRLPLNTPSLAARSAVLGRKTFGEFIDYRGTPVLAATRPIRGTDWGLVVKVDRSEALAPYHRDMIQQGLLLLAVLITLTGTGYGLWRRQRVRGLQAILAERERSEGRILQLNRLLRTISEINQLIVREQDRDRLLSGACRILVELGMFRMAWFGFKDESTGTVAPAASSEGARSYLDGVTVRWDDSPAGRGPTGTAIRENRHVLNLDVTTNPAMAPWRKAALAAGYRSSAAFPIRVRGAVLGALTVYADRPHAFGDEEVALLDELAGDLGYALEAIQERSDRLRTQEALLASQAKLRAFFDSDLVGTLFGDVHGNILEANDQYLRIVGYSREELKAGKVRWSDLTPPEWLPHDDVHIAEARERGACTPYEKEYVRKDGRRIWVLVGFVLIGPNREESVAFVLDLTRQKEAEGALRRSEGRFRTLVEDLGEGVGIVDPHETILYSNPAQDRIFGVETGTLVGRNLAEFSTPEEFGRYREETERRAQGLRSSYDTSIRRPDGEIRRLRVTSTPHMGEDGSFAGTFAICQDITERARAEEEIRRRDELLRLTGEMAHVGGWEFDPATGDGTWTDEVARIHDLDPALGTSVKLGLGFYSSESRPQIERAVKEAVESGTPYDLELQIVSAKGVPKWIRTQAMPVMRDGRVVQVRGTFQDITERKKASEALRASERFTEATLDALAAHICVLDERGRIIKVNRAWREFAAANGLSLADTGLGADYLAVCDAALGPDAPSAEAVAEAIRQIAEGGRGHYGAEYPCHSPEERRWFACRVTRFPGDGPVRIVVAHENITERKEAEIALRESEERFALFMQNLPAMAFIKDADSRYVFINHWLASALGKPHAELMSKPPEALYGAAQGRTIRANDADTLLRGEPVTWREVLHIGGRTRVFDSVKFPMPTPGGLLLGGIALDVTERVRSEEEVRLLNERLRDLARVVQELAAARDLPDVAEVVRRTARRLVGADGVTFVLRDGDQCHYVEEDAIGPLWKGMRFPLEECISGWTMLHREPAVIEDIYADARIPHDAYRPTFVRSLAMVPIRREEPIGAIGGYWAERRLPTQDEVAILQALADATARAIENVQLYEELERRVAERTAQLNSQKEFLAHVINALPDPVFVKDAAHRWTILNDAFCRFIGHSMEELLGRSDFDFFPEEEAQVFWEKDNEVFATGAENINEEPFTDANGRRNVISTKKSVFRDPETRERTLVGIIRDITERKRIEEEIRSLNERLVEEAVQLEAANKELESFSYSVSHDLRAPLRAIDGFSRAVEEDYGERLDDEGRRLLGIIRSSTRQMGQLIDDLLDLSRAGRHELRRGPVDMTALARVAFEGLAGAQPGPGVTFHLAPLENASGDPALLKQVWVNLMSNALKFSAGRAPAVIEVGGRRDGAEVVYWVRDNGVGFDDRYAHKLFGVFQRLHGTGEFPGTGVGLAIVKRIVNRHGGRVWAESRLGEGATFFFSLPSLEEDEHERT
ncbi:MAG: PAS domain S-box protein [Acidobacteriota bacterium]